MVDKDSLGCGLEFNMNTSNRFICGVGDAWGHEKLCKECKAKMILKWDEEDKIRYGENYIKNKGGTL